MLSNSMLAQCRQANTPCPGLLALMLSQNGVMTNILFLQKRRRIPHLLSYFLLMRTFRHTYHTFCNSSIHFAFLVHETSTCRRLRYIPHKTLIGKDGNARYLAPPSHECFGTDFPPRIYEMHSILMESLRTHGIQNKTYPGHERALEKAQLKVAKTGRNRPRPTGTRGPHSMLTDAVRALS